MSASSRPSLPAARAIVFFDFDGTISRRDSFIDFMTYTFGFSRFIKGMIAVSPGIMLYGFRLLSNEALKEQVLTNFFSDWCEEELYRAGDLYALRALPRIVKPSALERIAFHQQQGHRVVVVTASADPWLRGWCAHHGLELIATKLETREGRLTGKLSTRNCYGEEKVRRIKAFLDLDDYDHIYAYGDTRGDREMLALADEAYYRNFK